MQCFESLVGPGMRTPSQTAFITGSTSIMRQNCMVVSCHHDVTCVPAERPMTEECL